MPIGHDFVGSGGSIWCFVRSNRLVSEQDEMSSGDSHHHFSPRADSGREPRR